MIFRNGVEIKKVNQELANMSTLLQTINGQKLGQTATQYALDSFEAKAKAVADYLDRTDKVWINKSKFNAVKKDFDALVSDYNATKIALATRSINDKSFNMPSFDTIDDKMVGIDASVVAKNNYLNNPDNYRLKDKIHFVVTRGTATLLVVAAMIGTPLAVKEYKDRTSALTDSVDRLGEENESLKKENTDLSNENKELIKKNASVLEEIDKVKKEKDELQKQLENAQSDEEVKSLRLKLVETTARIVELESNLKLANSKINDLEQERDNLKAQNETLTKENANLLNDKSELNGKVETLSKEIASQKELIDQKDKEIAQLKSSIASLEVKISNLEKQLEDAKNNGNKEEIDRLNKLLAESKAVYKQLEDNYNQLNSDYAKLSEDYQKTSKELASEKTKNEMLQKSNDELKKLADSVDVVYKTCYSDDGKNLDSVTKLSKIVEYYTSNYGDSSELREFLVSFIANVKGVSYESIKSMSVRQIIDEASEILGMLQQPSENPGSNIKEDSTKKQEETKPEPEPDPISPDLPIRE